MSRKEKLRTLSYLSISKVFEVEEIDETKIEKVEKHRVRKTRSDRLKRKLKIEKIVNNLVEIYVAYMLRTKVTLYSKDIKKLRETLTEFVREKLNRQRELEITTKHIRKVVIHDNDLTIYKEDIISHIIEFDYATYRSSHYRLKHLSDNEVDLLRELRKRNIRNKAKIMISCKKKNLNLKLRNTKRQLKEELKNLVLTKEERKYIEEKINEYIDKLKIDFDKEFTKYKENIQRELEERDKFRYLALREIFRKT